MAASSSTSAINPHKRRIIVLTDDESDVISQPPSRPRVETKSPPPSPAASPIRIQLPLVNAHILSGRVPVVISSNHHLTPSDGIIADISKLASSLTHVPSRESFPLYALCYTQNDQPFILDCFTTVYLSSPYDCTDLYALAQGIRMEYNHISEHRFICHYRSCIADDTYYLVMYPEIAKLFEKLHARYKLTSVHPFYFPDHVLSESCYYHSNSLHPNYLLGLNAYLDENVPTQTDPVLEAVDALLSSTD